MPKLPRGKVSPVSLMAGPLSGIPWLLAFHFLLQSTRVTGTKLKKVNQGLAEETELGAADPGLG